VIFFKKSGLLRRNFKAMNWHFFKRLFSTLRAVWSQSSNETGSSLYKHVLTLILLIL